MTEENYAVAGKEWVADKIKKYDWEIDPLDATHPTIHGLRGTGILARWASGYSCGADIYRHRHVSPNGGTLHAVQRSNGGGGSWVRQD